MGQGKQNANSKIYKTFASVLFERMGNRELWGKQEREHVFMRMPFGCQPITFPVIYNNNSKEFAVSEHKDQLARFLMPNGSSEYLLKLVKRIKI